MSLSETVGRQWDVLCTPRGPGPLDFAVLSSPSTNDGPDPVVVPFGFKATRKSPVAGHPLFVTRECRVVVPRECPGRDLTTRVFSFDEKGRLPSDPSEGLRP